MTHRGILKSSIPASLHITRTHAASELLQCCLCGACRAFSCRNICDYVPR